MLAPVKLRPFKSTYHVRQGDQLRLICQTQRGFPAAHISWYVGNRLVDGEFLREHADEFRIIQQNGSPIRYQVPIVTSSSPASSSGEPSGQSAPVNDKRRIVEINPVPASRQQMQLTANGRGQWIEYRDLRNEKYAIETGEQQSKYLQLKLAQLAGSSGASSSSAASTSTPTTSSSSTFLASANFDQNQGSLMSQTSLSILVINSLNLDKHTSRYACRATTRSNTDEVTTVIRVQGKYIYIYATYLLITGFLFMGFLLYSLSFCLHLAIYLAYANTHKSGCFVPRQPVCFRKAAVLLLNYRSDNQPIEREFSANSSVLVVHYRH